jgi:ribonuclease T1
MARIRGVLIMAAVVSSVMACAAGAPASARTSDGLVGDAQTVENTSGLPTVRLADLPSEAAATVVLIDAGGPFPYRQDGAVFENREGILPDRPSGHYHEYTVPTPGSDDRGARRIVIGANGEMYWTADHYDSFSWIER